MIHLVRFAYLRDCTLGWLDTGGDRLATIERPWLPSPHHRGGMNAMSCVPDGHYELLRHAGPRFPNTFALTQDDLDVFYQPGDVPRGRSGRTAILIHAGNRVRDVIGCIAVGMAHVWMDGEHAVASSQIALNKLRAALAGELPILTIRPSMGTVEVTHDR